MAARVQSILAGRMIDVLFIDGDHRYEGAKKDFQLYSSMVCEGGMIAFHDIVPVRTDAPAELWAGDIPLLWQRIKPFYAHREFIEDPSQNGMGIGALIWDSTAKPTL